MNPSITIRRLAILTLLSALLWPAHASAESSKARKIVGTWYLALDAEPYGAPPGTNLAGLATFHRDHTVLFRDGGDFGGMPFTTRDTAQAGAWRNTAQGWEIVNLFLQADAVSGEVLSWQKVHILLRPDGPGRLFGVVNVYALACDLPAPFPVLGCPDPIESAAEFEPVPPFDVPVTYRRLEARLEP